jgi:hypothetical protein
LQDNSELKSAAENRAVKSDVFKPKEKSASKLRSKQNHMERLNSKFEKKENKLRVHNKKEFHIDFKRTQNSKGKFVTKANIVRRESSGEKPSAGLFHSLDYTLRNRLEGDMPSVTKKINSFKPKTTKGKAFKLTAKTANFIVHDVSRTALDVGMAAETFGFAATKFTSKKLAQIGTSAISNAYSFRARDDMNRAVRFSGKLIISGSKGLKTHFKEKKKARYAKREYKLKKVQFQKFNKITFKPQMKTAKADLKAKNSKFKAVKKSFKQANTRLGSEMKMLKAKGKSIDNTAKKLNLRKALYKTRKAKFKSAKKALNISKSALNSNKKSLKLDKKNAKKEYKLTRPANLISKATAYGATQLKASAKQKLLSADERNDTLKAINKGGEIAKKGAGKLKERVSPKRLIQKKNTQIRKLEKKSDKLKLKSKKLERKLNGSNSQRAKNKYQNKLNKYSTKNSKSRKKINKLKKSKGKILALSSVSSVVMILCVTMLMILTLIDGTFESIFGNSGWVMGTYTAQDKYLSKAEEYYTLLAYDMNEKILKVSSEDDWKKGLKDFKVDTSDMDDKPDEWIWGKSGEFNYDPVYDFDTFKLWSYLCAYYYDFDSDSNEVEYWEYDDDTEDVIDELFNAEYKFEYKYDNTSHWELRDEYECDNLWYRVYDSGYKDDYGYITFNGVPTKLKKYALDDTVYYNLENGEILNANDDYSATGWYFQDQRYDLTDSSGNTYNSFYTHSVYNYSTSYSEGYGFYADDVWFPMTYYSCDLADGSDLQKKFYAVVSPKDTVLKKYSYADDFKTIYSLIMSGVGLSSSYNMEYTSKRDEFYDYVLDEVETESYGSYDGYGWCRFYKKYDWVTDCRLYYNVKCKKTFDEVIKDKLKAMDNGDERYKLYEMFLGTADDSETTRGNHQEFASPLSDTMEDLITDGSILNGYGYDMQEWNTVHCDIADEDDSHQAIDISCSSGTKIYAAMDGTVSEIDNDKGLIVIKKKKYKYWYDGNGSGKKRDTEIYYYNVGAKSSLEVGDTVKKGDYIGLSFPEKSCEDMDNSSADSYYVHIKVYIDTDGPGWKFIDPRLVFE